MVRVLSRRFSQIKQKRKNLRLKWFLNPKSEILNPKSSCGFGEHRGLRYIDPCHDAEGSHNGSAAVLKTAGRKAMQVRVLSPPPFL